MKKLLTLLIALSFSAPCYAGSYLIFSPDEPHPVMVWDGAQPTPGKEIPAGYKVHVLVPLADETGRVETDFRKYINSVGGPRLPVKPDPPPPGPPAPDIPKFFDGLVKSILSGEIPGDVHSKALMVKDLKSPADQAAALTAFSSDPSYTKEQKLILDQLIKESNLALPDVPGKE